MQNKSKKENSNIFKEKFDKKKDEYKSSIYDKTKKYQKIYNFQLGTGSLDTHNNEADAFKHTFGSAHSCIYYNSIISKLAWDQHEKSGNKNNKQPKYEENMDKWNNRVGRQIAKEIQDEYKNNKLEELKKNNKIEDIIAEKVMQKMRAGKLITNPFKDKRIFKESSTKDNIYNLKNRIFHVGEVKAEDINDQTTMNTVISQILDNKLPTKEELDKRVKTGELVYVHDYERDDGTKVSGYYREYPNC